MNKIKDAFSKIKASDEFKTKLSVNLQSPPKKLKTARKRPYFNPMIAVASILLVMIGIIQETGLSINYLCQMMI